MQALGQAVLVQVQRTHEPALMTAGFPYVQKIEKTEGKEMDSDSSSGADDTAHAGHPGGANKV